MNQKLLGDTIDQLLKVLEAAGKSLSRQSILIEYSEAPHKQPSNQLGGLPGVYAFFYQGRCLKCGQVGPNSAARYTSQHYNPKSSKSNFALTLQKHGRGAGLSIPDNNIGDWIKTNTARVNVLLPKTIDKKFLNFVEAFFHVCWNPVFEGREWLDWDDRL